MFGAHGLYCGAQFFGLLDAGRLFFKTNSKSAKDYTARGMEPFTYQARGKTVTLGFYEVPPEILEQPLELVTWARQAVKIASARAVKKSGRNKKRSTSSPTKRKI